MKNGMILKMMARCRPVERIECFKNREWGKEIMFLGLELGEILYESTKEFYKEVLQISVKKKR